MDTVIGKGVVAERFLDYELQTEFMIFAGSIHDLTIKDSSLIQEEEHLLEQALSRLGNSTFVYFSSCGILDTDLQESEFVKHKIRMEKLIQSKVEKYFIFRLPEIIAYSTGDTNFISHLVGSVLNERPVEVWKSARYNFMDIDDVYEIVKFELKTGNYLNTVLNVANKNNYYVSEVILSIEHLLGQTAICNEVEKGLPSEIDTSAIELTIKEIGLNFGEEYLSKSIKKHFGHIISGPRLLSVVVPTYNEEQGIDEFYRRTKIILETFKPRFEHEIIFVNDYSTDNTLHKLRILAKNDPTVKVINFSRNFGNQIGITAGIDNSRGDIAIIIDDDLQDPPEIMLNFISAWERGYKVVYGVRPKRQNLSFLFKSLAMVYYRLINSLSDIHIPNDTGDFRLLDRTVIDALRFMKEENRYYRGMVAWVGFQQIGVTYERDKRFAGVSTFSIKKYITFAISGLTSFSDKPLYFSNVAGAIITLVSFITTIFLVFARIFDPSFSVPGWTSLAIIMLFFGGIQLLSIGILGVYISKIYREVRQRPLYLIESSENLGSDEED